MKILKQNEDQEQSGATGEISQFYRNFLYVQKFRNYSEIFARIAKFSLCTKISLAKFRYVAKILYGCSPIKDKNEQ